MADQDQHARHPVVQHVADIKTEPGSPSSSEGTSTRHSFTSSMVENGYNGLPHSEDSEEDCSDTDEAPLDFSIRKRDPLDEPPHGVSEGQRGPPTNAISPHTRGINDRGERSPVERRPFVNGRSPVSPPLPEAGEIRADYKIGEPQTALPGMAPGTVIPGMTAAGMIPGIPPAMLLGQLPASMFGALPIPEQQRLSGEAGTGGKSTRPFKAYPKDPLSLPLGYYGIPNVPGVAPVPNVDVAAAQALSQNSEEMFKQYREYVLKMQSQLRQQRGSKQNGRVSNRRSSESSGSASPVSSQTNNTGAVTPNGMSPASVTSSTPSRKRGRTLPEDQKDQAYWERRRKNNDAAKRSRDTRRAKEDEIAIRAAFLEQENLKLRVELAALKNETAKLRCMLYNS